MFSTQFVTFLCTLGKKITLWFQIVGCLAHFVVVRLANLVLVALGTVGKRLCLSQLLVGSTADGRLVRLVC